DEGGHRPVCAPQMIGRRTGHAPSELAQSVPREPPVQHALGVVNLPMAHEMEAVGGHRSSLRRRVLWTGWMRRPDASTSNGGRGPGAHVDLCPVSERVLVKQLHAREDGPVSVSGWVETV